MLDADPAKVDVAYHGIDTAVFHPPTDAGAGAGRAAPRPARLPYVGSLGEMSRRKNIPELIRGWVLAVAEMADPPALVLAGSSTADPAILRRGRRGSRPGCA